MRVKYVCGDSPFSGKIGVGRKKTYVDHRGENRRYEQEKIEDTFLLRTEVAGKKNLCDETNGGDKNLELYYADDVSSERRSHAARFRSVIKTTAITP
jgi:hypothetical protein